MRRVYLDHNATTPVAPEVLDAMWPVLQDDFGNASSLHWFGQRARGWLDTARGDVAAAIGATAQEIVFTSGGTEADNMALFGVGRAARGQKRKILYSELEHHAVVRAAESLLRDGHPVEKVACGADGRIDLNDLERRIDEQTALVTVMLANNETGVIQPVREVVALARRVGALVHCDAVQGFGKMPVDVRDLGVDLASFSAHKTYGPKGIGALFVRRGTLMEATIRGGSQEKNRRAGTENVAAAVGFGRAARLVRERSVAAVGPLRDRLEQRLCQEAGGVVNGSGPRVDNTTNVSFAGADAESLTLALDLEGIAVSTGAACAAGAIEPSHVLRAMHLSPSRVQGSVRYSLGRGNTEDDVEAAVEATTRCLARQRELAR